MKVTCNWIKDFVDISLSPSELADRLTMAGLEVEEAVEKNGDTVFSIEVTSNRPDWLSVYGIAREVAAITGKGLQSPCAAPPAAGKERFGIEIENRNDCPLYTARILRGVTVADAPGWMRQRLELVGVRPVNNIVDITNYVLFEMGEPLHAFDLDKLTLPVVVRRARAGEKITAIDGKEYALDPGVLVIADAEKPVAIAGVMGGKDTEVTSSTKNILLEAAIFDPVLVRRGRQKLGLQSEASYRFERGIDPGMVNEASLRACRLVNEIAGGALAGAESGGSASEKPGTIVLDPSEVEEILGVEIGAAEIGRILSSLGFVVEKGKDSFSVGVPSFRRDVKAAIDLVEEVARIHGFDNIPSVFPALSIQPARKPPLNEAVKEALICQGLDEVLTYSLIDRKYIAGSGGPGIVEVADPLSAEQEIMRPAFMPSLVKCVAHNLNQRRPSVAVFEVAKTYSKPDKEHNVLGIALSGTFKHWFGPQAGNVSYTAGFLGLKGILDALLARVGIGVEDRSYAYSDGFTVELKVRGERIGFLRQLRLKELDLFQVKDRDVFVAELSLDMLLPMAGERKIFKAYPRFPSVSRDITLEVKTDVPVSNILEKARQSGAGLLKEVSFLDYYDKNLPRDTKRITITCVYAAEDRTLTEAEVAPVHTAIVESLSAAFPVTK